MKNTLNTIALAAALTSVGCADTYPEVQYEDDMAAVAGTSGTSNVSNINGTGGSNSVPTSNSPETDVAAENPSTVCEPAIAAINIEAVQKTGCDLNAKLNTILETGNEEAVIFGGETFMTADNFGGEHLVLTPEAGTCGPVYGATIMSGSRSLEFSEPVDLYQVSPSLIQGETNEKLIYLIDALHCHIDPACDQSGTGVVLSYVGRSNNFQGEDCQANAYVFTNDLY